MHAAWVDEYPHAARRGSVAEAAAGEVDLGPGSERAVGPIRLHQELEELGPVEAAGVEVHPIAEQPVHGQRPVDRLEGGHPEAQGRYRWARRRMIVHSGAAAGEL